MSSFRKTFSITVVPIILTLVLIYLGLDVIIHVSVHEFRTIRPPDDPALDVPAPRRSGLKRKDDSAPF